MLDYIAQGIVEELAPSKMAVGEIVDHPDGRRVLIVSGSFYGSYGRVSNFWNWKEIGADGSFGPLESGYGW
jgi:hypothetical protein